MRWHASQVNRKLILFWSWYILFENHLSTYQNSIYILLHKPITQTLQVLVKPSTIMYTRKMYSRWNRRWLSECVQEKKFYYLPTDCSFSQPSYWCYVRLPYLVHKNIHVTLLHKCKIWRNSFSAVVWSNMREASF